MFELIFELLFGFLLENYGVNLILIAAAVIPAVFLLMRVYRADKVEKEPPRFLFKLVMLGLAAAIAAIILEGLGTVALSRLFDGPSLLLNVLMYMGVVAFSEEGAKLFFLKRASWNSPDFNCSFDGVVYAAFMALGFALWENLGYVFTNGLGVAIIRALTAVPGHACFGVFMGCWYAEAKMLERAGDIEGSKRALRVSLFLPALLHGLYDLLAVSASEGLSPWIFVGFVVVLFVLTIRLTRRLSAEDRFI